MRTCTTSTSPRAANARRHITTALLLCAVGGLTIAGTVTTKTVRGKLRASADESDAAGRFNMDVREKGDRAKERLGFTATGLDAAKDDNGVRPTYDLVLITSDDAEADLGAVKLRRNGAAKFKYRSKQDGLGDDFDGLADFGGGTIELRDGDDVVLEGDIPEFLSAGDDPEPGDGATYEARNSRKLKPTTDDSDAKGFITAQSKAMPRSDFDRVVVEVIRAGRRGDELTVVAIDRNTGDETELGTLKLRGRFQAGALKLDTRKGDEIPGGGIGDLDGQSIEVRDGDDAVVLSGRFPSLGTSDDE